MYVLCDVSKETDATVTDRPQKRGIFCTDVLFLLLFICVMGYSVSVIHVLDFETLILYLKFNSHRLTISIDRNIQGHQIICRHLHQLLCHLLVCTIATVAIITAAAMVAGIRT